MIRKEQLLAIHELKLSGVINTMTDSQLAGYAQALNQFVDSSARYAEGLTKALEAGHYSLLSKRLSELCDTLKKIHADDLAADCQKQSKSLVGAGQTSIDHDGLEMFVENLVQSISALSIEVQMAAHKSTAMEPARPRAPRQMSSRATILAVDNAVMFLNTLKKLLSDAPYDLHCVTSGAEALDFLEYNRPDAILLDVEMPDMNGYELARRIRKSGRSAPIIFITANSAREYVDKAVEVGAVGLLMKPLRVNQLLEKLKEHV